MAPRTRPPGSGRVGGKFLVAAGQCRIHPASARERLYLAGHRRQQVAPGVSGGLLFPGAAVGKAGQPLPDPEKARGPAVARAEQPRNPGLGLVGLRHHNARACYTGFGLAEPSFRDAEGAGLRLDLDTDLGGTASMRPELADLLAARPMGHEEQGAQGVEHGRLAEFVGRAQHVHAVVEAIDAHRVDEPADVLQGDRAQFHRAPLTE